MSKQWTERIKDTESKKERDKGQSFCCSQSSKCLAVFEPARVDLRAVVGQSQKMRVKITGEVGGVISAKLAATTAVPPL